MKKAGPGSPLGYHRRVRWTRFLETPRLGVWLAVVSVVLGAASLFGGFQTEDWIFRDLATSTEFTFPNQLNLFGHREQLPKHLMVGMNMFDRERGALPWLVFEGFQVSFWRPLSSLTHLLDFKLWPDAAALMHAHSLLWYAALVMTATALYRRWMSPAWVAGLAAIMFAVDDAHGQAVGWISNRNALVAAALATLGLLLHDKWRRDGWLPGLALGPLFFLGGLLGGELALGALAYVVVHALTLDTKRWRWLAPVPWIAVAVGWASFYRDLGHRALGCGIYLDPVFRPIDLLIEGPQRALVLLLGLFGAPPSDSFQSLYPDRTWLLVVGGGVLLVVMIAILWPLLRREPVARFFLGSTLLSLSVATLPMPEDRLLLLPGLGAMGLVALSMRALLDETREFWASPTSRRVAWALVGGWAVLHLVVGPVLLPYRSLRMKRYETELRAAATSAFDHVNQEKQVLIILNAPDYYFSSMMVLGRLARGEPVAHRTYTLAGTREAVRVKRVDQHAISVRPEGGFFSRPLNRLYRSPVFPLVAGDHVTYDGVVVTIDESNDRREPTSATFRFDWALEHASVVVLEFKDGTYRRIAPLAVGEEIVVSG